MYSREIEEYKKKLKLTDLQREILVGVLLGDACLETQNQGRTYRLKIEHSMSQSAYVQHLYESFKAWALQEPKLKEQKIGNKTHQKLWFNTVSHGVFRFYAQQFYHSGEKVAPKLIKRLLTERSLAYWFMDDGSIKSKQSKAVIFNTQGFKEHDVKKLILTLREKFSLEAKQRRQKEGMQIYVSGNSYEHFCRLVEAYVISAMRYKIPDERKNKKQKPDLTYLPKM